MSRPSPPDNHHHNHDNYAEGDSVPLCHTTEASEWRSHGEVSGTYVGLSCQGRVPSSETARNHRPQAEDHMSQSQVVSAQESCTDDLFNPGKRSSKRSRNEEDFDCRTKPLMSIQRERQGNGCSGESRKANNVGDQMSIECNGNKLQENINNSVKRDKKQTHSSGNDAFTSLKNERDAKPSSRWVLGDANGQSSNKGNTYECIHLSHNELEEILGSAVCRQKSDNSRSSVSAGRLLCSASDDPDVAGQVTHEIEFRSQREDCAYSDHSSSKSTSVHESQDMNVVIQAVPETNAMVSRLKFYPKVVAKAPATDKNSTESNCFPSDQSVNETKQISPSVDRDTKTHDTVTTSSVMATDGLKCSNETSQVSEAMNHQAEVTPQHGPQQNVSQENIENAIEKTVNPSEGTLGTFESRQTDHSAGGDVTQINGAPDAHRQIQKLCEDAGEESPTTKEANAKPPLRETKSEEQNTASPSADNLKSEYTEPQGSMRQCIHNKNKWVFSNQWTPADNTSETKPTETNPNKKHNMCMMTKSFDIDGNTAVKRTKKMKATKSLKEEHSFEGKETAGCAKRRRALGRATAGADKQGDWQEMVQLDESDTDTPDSKGCHLLQQLQMVQSCKRKANVLLKHVQNIIDGSRRPEENVTVNTEKRPRASSKHQDKGKEPTALHKSERKSRPKSESPVRLHRKSHGMTTLAKAGEHSRTVEKSYKMPHETLSIDNNNVHLGLMRHETSMRTWMDYTTIADGDMSDAKTTCILDKSELLPNNHGEKMHNYHQFNHFNSCECEAKKHLTATDTHRLQQRQLAIRRDKCSAPYSEFELRSAEFCCPDNQPAGQEDYAFTEKYSYKEPQDRRYSPTKCEHWISAALGEAITATNYYENVSNTSATSDSVFVCNDVGSEMYKGDDFFTKDSEHYHLLENSDRNSFSRSRSVNPHISRRESELENHQKTSTTDKRYKISRSSVRQSLKDAIKSAKESISAAAKVAEALSFVVKASTDSSTSLSSEAGNCPVWKQRQSSKSPAPKVHPSDSMRPMETTGTTPRQSPAHRSSVWRNAEAQYNTLSVQENIDSQPYRRHKKKRLSSLQQQLKDKVQDAKSSTTTHIKNGSLRCNGRHVNGCQNLLETDANVPATLIAVSRRPNRITDSSSRTWDDVACVNKYYTFESKKNSNGLAHKSVALKSPVVSPKIMLQLTISNSPESSFQPNVNYLVDQPVHRKDNPTANICLMSGHKTVLHQRSQSEFEQLSELALSKEDWTVSHSCCSSARKTSSYLIDDNQVDYSSSAQRVFRRHKRNAYDDGSANIDGREFIKYNDNVNRSPACKHSNTTLLQTSQQSKQGQKSKSFPTESPSLPPTGKHRTPGQLHESCNQECNQSELMLTHHQNSLTTPKKPKPSKANLCLSRSYKIADTTTCQRKVHARYQGQINRSYTEKVTKTREFSQDAQGKTPEINIPVCYSDPSSPNIYHEEFEGPYTNHSGEIRSLLETSNQMSKGKTRRCSSINRQNDIQGVSPRFAFFPNYCPDLPTGNRKAYLEYESQHGQTKVYVEMEPTFSVQGAKIQTLQKPRSGVFPLSGPYSSSLGFSTLSDSVLHGGDVKGASPIWDNWPEQQGNHCGSNKNVNNNNRGVYFDEDDTNDRKDGGRSDAGAPLAVDHTIVNENTVAGSRLDLQPVGKQFPADKFGSNGYTVQQWPVLAASEDFTNGHACIIIARRSLRRFGESAGATENSRLDLRPKNNPKEMWAQWQEASSLIAHCREILGNNAHTLEQLLRLYVTQQRNVAKQRREVFLIGTESQYKTLRDQENVAL